MGFIGWIVVGIIAGWIAEKIMKKDHGLLTNLIVGIVGAVIGGWLLSLVGIEGNNGMLMSIVTAVIGAVVLLWGWGLIRGKSNAE